MVMSIDNALVIQFAEDVRHLAQQMETRLKGKVDEKMVRGNEFTVENIGATEAIPINTRFQDTQFGDAEFTRRGAKMTQFARALSLDVNDDLQTLIDPQSAFARNLAMALMRKYDRVILEAALGDALFGRRLENTITAAADGVETVAANATGLTFAKLQEIRENFMNAEVGLNFDEEIYLCITATQLYNLYADEEMISRDFVSGAGKSFDSLTSVDTGMIDQVMGIKLIVFGKSANPANDLIKKVGDDRQCIAFVKRGITVGMNRDIEIRIDELPNKNYNKQVWGSLTLGAVRTEGALVQRVDCQE